MTVPQTPRLQVDHVSCDFDGRVVVRDVSLQVAPGEIMCLLGPSGCGKSTTLRVIAGVERQNAGRILVDGQVMSDDRDHRPPEARGIGLMFQDFALFPHLSVAQNVSFGLTGAKAEKSARVAELLERVDLAGYGQKSPHMLSGGEQQRVALARASAPRPHILLADEPTGNLDEANGGAIMDLLFHLRDRHGATLVLVTHAPSLAARCDRVVRLRDGRIDAQAREAAE